MSERYSRVYTLSSKLYVTDAPIVIAAGALLKDMQTGKLLAQLKFCNVQTKLIKAVKVRLYLQDAAGRELGVQEHSILDLDAKRDEMFGQKAVATLENAQARAFTAKVTEVVFADQTMWKSEENAEWFSLTPARALQEQFGDVELAKQYQIEVGQDAQYYPVKDEALWRCTCGVWNDNADAVCHRCQRAFDALTDMDVQELREKATARLNNDAKAKKKSRLLIVIAAVAAVAMIAGVIGITSYKKATNYNKAIELFLDGEDSQSCDLLDELGSYKNSVALGTCFATYAHDGFGEAVQYLEYRSDEEFAEMAMPIVMERTYREAKTDFENRNYAAAGDSFGWLAEKNYADSAELAVQCEIWNAILTQNTGYFKNHLGLFERIGGDQLKQMLLGDNWLWIEKSTVWTVDFKENNELDIGTENGEYCYWTVSEYKDFNCVVYAEKQTDVTFANDNYTVVRHVNDDILFLYEYEVLLVKAESTYANAIKADKDFTILSE